MDVPAISCSRLTKRFGDVKALDGLDLEVPRGGIFGFLGPNGAGKTTAMRILLGLARPSGGTARVMGFDVTTHSLDVRGFVGYLPQQPQFPSELTTREVLRYARGFHPRERDSRIEDEVSDALDLVGLRAKAGIRAGDLSGGQRQRLGIAQACIHRPQLLILDEPAAALDPLGRRDVLDIMRRLRGTATVFYSTHILDDVQQVSDEVAILKQGRRVLQAPLDTVLGVEEGHAFTLALSGEFERPLAAVQSQPWVAEVSARFDGDEALATIRVLDVDRAYSDLLRVVLRHDHVRVMRFGPATTELEDVFIDLVQESRS